MAGANPLSASDYQPLDDIARLFAEGADSAIAGQINAGFEHLRDGLDVVAIAALLAVGGWIAVKRLITAQQITDAMRPATTALVHLQSRVGASAMAGEVTSASTLRPSALVPPLASTATQTVIPLTYDPIAPAQVAAQQATQSAWLRQVASTIEAVIDQDISQGLRNGMRSDEIARVIKATVGLTPRQAAAVANYRRLLETGDASALDRVLRDRRYDASVQRAIDGTTLSQDKIDRMVDRYAERYQAHRATTIAQTETLRASNEGRRAAWEQYADRKGLGGDDVLRWWLTAHDERVCPVCSAIPLMNPDGVAVGDPYLTPNGPEDMPPIHPNCRCTERYGLATDAGVTRG